MSRAFRFLFERRTCGESLAEAFAGAVSVFAIPALLALACVACGVTP